MNSTKLVEHFTYYFGVPVWVYFPATHENKPFIKDTNRRAAEFLFAKTLHSIVANGFHAQKGIYVVRFYTNEEIPFYDESSQR